MTHESTRGERNNNPGNIRKTPIKWGGEIEGKDPAFETFDKPGNGIRALAKILVHYQRKDGLNTVQEIIGKWAPSSENNTGAYVGAVCNDCGVTSDMIINLQQPDVLTSLVKAIIRHENGRVIYSDRLIASGAAEALA